MPRLLNRLSARGVATLTKPGRHADGGRLYLSIGRNGRKSWTFMFVRDGRQREMGLGAASDVPLAKARELAALARLELAAGNDPLEAKHAYKAVPTFGDVADEVLKTATARSKNEKHQAQWTRALNVEALALRGIRVDQVSTEDILAVLKPVWEKTPETASRLRGRIERVLDAAAAKGHRSRENPARWTGHLVNLLPPKRKLVRGHHAAMPFADVPEFVGQLASRPATAARLLEFLIHAAARIGEVTNATWQEFDLKNKIWTVPAARMKAGREHRVPLSDRAMHILAEMRSGGEPDPAGFVFAGAKTGKPLSNAATKALMKRMDVTITNHGFRSSFRDWAGERTAFAREVAEAALAHTVGDETERAYRRGDALEKRRKLMAAWSSFVTSAPAESNVVGIRSTASR